MWDLTQKKQIPDPWPCAINLLMPTLIGFKISYDVSLKGSLGAAVKLPPCDHEVTGSSPGNSLLQKCRERLRTIDPKWSDPSQTLRKRELRAPGCPFYMMSHFKSCKDLLRSLKILQRLPLLTVLLLSFNRKSCNSRRALPSFDRLLNQWLNSSFFMTP
jgi:hypothetical protein